MVVTATAVDRRKVFATVPRLFPNSTMAILAGGPSLTQEDIDACRGRARVLAVKDTIRLAPWADVLYACDARWWKHHADTITFAGPKFGLEPFEGRPDVGRLRHTGIEGLETEPDGVRTGRNSGYQAIQVAVHLGATHIVLLGFDMGPDAHGRRHWFSAHPWHSDPPFHLFLPAFDTLVAPLARLGVTVVNATRLTALRAFPRVSLEEALA